MRPRQTQPHCCRAVQALLCALILATATLHPPQCGAAAVDPAQSVARAALAPQSPGRPAWGPPLPAPVAYRGLGTWVDIYDDSVFDHPERAVRSMAARGVRSIYVETANSGARSAIYRPAAMSRLIRAAHAREMRVVAWYLPSLRDPARDYYRCVAAIRFRTYDRQRFDSFALDIESSAVTPVSVRNARLVALSKKIRAAAGRSYPLAAIIPSPVGMDIQKDYWPDFPYASLAPIYDVVMPMTYYTYRWDGEQAVFDSMVANISRLRSKPGHGRMPIHPVGGLASRSSTAEVRAFASVARDTLCCGASLYDWTTTSSGLWPELGVANTLGIF